MRVHDMLPGMKVSTPTGEEATLISVQVPHPRYPMLALVIWWMGSGWFSLDALSPLQVMDFDVWAEDQRYETRMQRLLDILKPNTPPTNHRKVPV